MLNPTYYTSKDAGITWPSPAAVSIRSAYKSSYYAIYHMLKSCLVEGYPGKPAAGWSMLFDEIALGTGIRYALTNAARSGVILVDNPDPSNGYLRSRITVCEALPDLDTPINPWSHKYGPQAGEAGNGHWWCPDSNSGFYSESAATIAPFFLVANENACFFSLHSQENQIYTTSLTGSYTENIIAAYLGASNGAASLGTISAPELGNFMVMGGTALTYATAATSQDHKLFYNSGAPSTVTSSLRDHTGAAHTTEPPMFGNSVTQGQTTPTAPLGAQTHCYIVPLLAGPAVGYSYTAHTSFRSPLHVNLAGWNAAATREILQLNGGDFYTPTTIDGREYVAFTGLSYVYCPLISLDPADWL